MIEEEWEDSTFGNYLRETRFLFVVYKYDDDNVRDVIRDFYQVCDENELSRVYVNFCDPWKKSRQAKRRLTHSNYLTMYEKLLIEGGELHFKTDNTMLFEFSLNSFSEFGVKMKNITLDLHNSKFEGNVMTEYETLFSQKGQPIYRCEVIFPRR